MSSNPLADFVPGDMTAENYNTFDLHRPYVDDIVLVSTSGKAMKRESDLIDVWFDSGSMPYAQLHYPFENKELFETCYPADFIAEGVDQTRGWFFTLHAIASILFDSVAFKNVVSNGLVLDKNGNKMSKRLGNAIDPFTTLDKYGPDATRWYMISNAQPWDNLKFDLEGIDEVRRKFFGTLYNTYAFFALYANIDGFAYEEEDIPLNERPEIDRWILSELNSLIEVVTNSLSDYEPTKTARAIQEFVNDNLSNWYVRLCRRRFWKGDYGQNKISAYQTLYACLDTVAVLSAPIAPFFMDRLFQDLNKTTNKNTAESVHLASLPIADKSAINADLEERMRLAQDVTSMVLSLRKKERIRVRQPLQKIMIPVLNNKVKTQLEAIKDLVLAEVNVKELEFMTENSGILIKKIKPNFKTLGPKHGRHMKAISEAVAQFSADDVNEIEKNGSYSLKIGDDIISLELADVEISSEDIPGWTVASLNGKTVALDINITAELAEEGLARELINRIQNLRKDNGLEVTDRIEITINAGESLSVAVSNNLNYICSETLADNLRISTDTLENVQELELVKGVKTYVSIKRKD